ncbi:MAG: CAP domain-containing protein [Chloroflexi bacterium]|nr:MAG: CAP domain-containing protein [Chloroflexota bacterium]
MGRVSRRASTFIATLVLLLALGASPAAAGGSTLQTLINQDRATNGGLPALAWSDCLASVAMANAQRIANQGFLSHTDGPTNDLKCGVGATSAGENVAYISSGINDTQVNTMYMNSPGHRANILGNYTYVATAWVVAPNGYAYNAEEFLNAPSLVPSPPTGNTFYFAEGFTGGGFTETLSILMPNQSGSATIDFYTAAGHLPTITRSLTAGQVWVEDVNADAGPNQQVSAIVALSGPGVVERTMHFNYGNWHGSTDVVGTPLPQTEWDFAEGSTLSIFSEFLTMQNPYPAPVVVDLNYATDMGAHPVKTLTLAGLSRTTVAVYQGDLTNNPGCTASSNCGVGGGIVGVSVQVKSRGFPIVVERPFYVNGYNFGAGIIRDGHDAFGANAAATQWNFAEGNTLAGFNEYLTLQNPGGNWANVTLTYQYDLGTATRTLSLSPMSRQTVLVFDAAHHGLGAGYVGVSVQITADQPIVAERPMYMVRDFGSGPVAGAHVVVGATALSKLFGFSAASTLAGDNDYLTIQNPNGVAANISIAYYTTGGKVTKAFAVAANSRHTVLVFSNNGEGIGPNLSPLGMVVTSDQPILVEKATYGSNPASYGATDTAAYSPSSF